LGEVLLFFIALKIAFKFVDPKIGLKLYKIRSQDKKRSQVLKEILLLRDKVVEFKNGEIKAK
jgi:hypothetical protein